MKKVWCCFVMVWNTAAVAQLTESFTDGDFTTGMTWTGTSSSWKVVSSSDVGAGAEGSETLQLNVAQGAGTAYVSTRVAGSWGAEQSWGFWLGRRAQAAMASNTSYVWLYASEPDINGITVDGYRIRFGDDVAAGDRIVLEKVKDGVGTGFLFSAGAVANGLTDYGILVRVKREASGRWSVYSSALPLASGTGAVASDMPDSAHTVHFQGSATDKTYENFDNGYLVLAATYSSGAVARSGAEFDQLVFHAVTGVALPVRFGFLKAMHTQRGLDIQWNNLTEADLADYTLESSPDGEQFSSLAVIKPHKNDGGIADYHYVVPSARITGNLYRVRARETNGHTIYSNMIRVENTRAASLCLYPDPVSSGTLTVQVQSLPPGLYTCMVVNVAGQVLVRETWTHKGGSLTRPVPLEQGKAGIYILVIRGPALLYKQFVVQ